MDEDLVIQHLIALHAGLERLGPGSPEDSLRALAACAGLPPRPDVLDLGCGAGAAALLLAERTGGAVTAIDLAAPFLADLRAEAARRGLGDRVRAVEADMAAPPFPDGRFDLLWSEGAVYNIGFDAGIAAWRRLLRPGGYLALSELCWLSAERPAEAVAHWAIEYPPMRSLEAIARAAEAAGYAVVDRFALSAAGWRAYHDPLERRLDAFAAAHPDDPVAAAVVASTRREIALVRRHGDAFGYGFLVLRRVG